MKYKKKDGYLILILYIANDLILHRLLRFLYRTTFNYIPLRLYVA